MKYLSCGARGVIVEKGGWLHHYSGSISRLPFCGWLLVVEQLWSHHKNSSFKSSLRSDQPRSNNPISSPVAGSYSLVKVFHLACHARTFALEMRGIN